MKKNIFNFKSTLSLSLIVVMMLSLASCSGRESDTAFLDQVSKAEAYSEDDVSIEESSEAPTEEGYTAKPIITHIENKEPYSVVVAGTCEEGSTIKVYNVASKDETYETKAIGNYFILELSLSNTNEHYYEASAVVEGKKESKITYFTAQYDAVAEKPLDGTAVTLGNDSTLFYDSLIPSYKGENILTNTQLKEFKDKIQTNANKDSVKYVYVMIPGVLSVYEDRIPDSITKDSYKTKFNQIVDALSDIKNTDVIDLSEKFIENKNSDYPLYYNTSSNLSDFGSYITYQAIIDYISKDYPSISKVEQSFEGVEGKGGDLVNALGLDNTIFTEKYYYAKYDTSSIPENSEMTCPVSDIAIYADKESNTLYTDVENAEVTGACESIFFKTNRVDLPSAVFLRDDSVNSIVPMLAGNFNNSYFDKNGNLTLSSSSTISAISSYATQDKTYVDYVFVLVSEENIDSILNG